MNPGEMYPCAAGDCPHKITIAGYRLRLLADPPDTRPEAARARLSDHGPGYVVELLASPGPGLAIVSLGEYPATIDADAPPDAAGELVEVRRGPFGRSLLTCPLLDALSSLLVTAAGELDGTRLQTLDEAVRCAEAAAWKSDPRAFAVASAAAQALAKPPEPVEHERIMH